MIVVLESSTALLPVWIERRNLNEPGFEHRGARPPPFICVGQVEDEQVFRCRSWHHWMGATVGELKVVVQTCKTPLDGSETPFLINGKPTGQTYAGKRIDSRHTIGVIKMNGKPLGMSKAELSADGKTITVENDNAGASGGTSAGKRIEHWDKR